MLAFAAVDSWGQRVEDSEDVLSPAPLSSRARDHWSYRPLERPPVPNPSTGRQLENPIDRFIVARHDEHDLIMQPEANRRVQIRRLYLDLAGRPALPSEIELHLNDNRPGAYEQLVDRLLASPEFGIRWGQQWLDLARYADTDGFEHDKTRPEAWRYRDWAIEAINQGMAYDQFVRWQIAGDELAAADRQSDADRMRIATAFCLSGPDMPDINSMEERRHNLLNEITSTVGGVFLAMQLQCAQCHDHMFDPITQGDFYRLRALFSPSIRPLKNKSVSYLENSSDEERVDRLMNRGDWQSPGPRVEPGFPRVVDYHHSESHPLARTPADRRRTALADWLTTADHPLTARVFVNRLWQYYFTTGLCRTPNDFGHMGSRPTHPELMDWLAAELVESNWNPKHVHRLIVTSATYRQAGTRSAQNDGALGEHRDRDPANKWLSRFPTKRLTGEAIRDSMLSLGGMMDSHMGGTGVMPPLPPEMTSTLLKNQWSVSPRQADHYRRSIYIFARRNLRFPIFDAFDRPDANASCPRRHRSTTAPQSLLLMNSDFSAEMAERFAARLLAIETDDANRIRTAFEFAFGRLPDCEEQAMVVEYIEQEMNRESFESELLARKSAWTGFCLALFNSNEFIYYD